MPRFRPAQLVMKRPIVRYRVSVLRPTIQKVMCRCRFFWCISPKKYPDSRTVAHFLFIRSRGGVTIATRERKLRQGQATESIRQHFWRLYKETTIASSFLLLLVAGWCEKIGWLLLLAPSLSVAIGTSILNTKCSLIVFRQGIKQSSQSTPGESALLAEPLILSGFYQDSLVFVVCLEENLRRNETSFGIGGQCRHAHRILTQLGSGSLGRIVCAPALGGGNW